MEDLIVDNIRSHKYGVDIVLSYPEKVYNEFEPDEDPLIFPQKILALTEIDDPGLNYSLHRMKPKHGIWIIYNRSSI